MYLLYTYIHIPMTFSATGWHIRFSGLKLISKNRSHHAYCAFINRSNVGPWQAISCSTGRSKPISISPRIARSSQKAVICFRRAMVVNFFLKLASPQLISSSSRVSRNLSDVDFTLSFQFQNLFLCSFLIVLLCDGVSSSYTTLVSEADEQPPVVAFPLLSAVSICRLYRSNAASISSSSALVGELLFLT